MTGVSWLRKNQVPARLASLPVFLQSCTYIHCYHLTVRSVNVGVQRGTFRCNCLVFIDKLGVLSFNFSLKGHLALEGACVMARGAERRGKPEFSVLGTLSSVGDM